jgi:hypothetical protein
MSGKPDTARSYRTTILDDNAIVSINLKWLAQGLVLVALVINLRSSVLIIMKLLPGLLAFSFPVFIYLLTVSIDRCSSDATCDTVKKSCNLLLLALLLV